MGRCLTGSVSNVAEVRVDDPNHLSSLTVVEHHHGRNPRQCRIPAYRPHFFGRRAQPEGLGMNPVEPVPVPENGTGLPLHTPLFKPFSAIVSALPISVVSIKPGNQVFHLVGENLLEPHHIKPGHRAQYHFPTRIPRQRVCWIVIADVECHHRHFVRVLRRGLVEIQKTEHQRKAQIEVAQHYGQVSSVPGRIFAAPPAFATLSRTLARKSRLFHKGTLLELDILDVAFGGKGIAKVSTEEGEFTVFVPNAIQGQRVRARVSRCKRRHAEARITAVLQRAPEETESPFQAIPGAPYITLPLAAQRAWKERTTLDVYRRIGGISNLEESYGGWVDSPAGFHYRNKMEYSFAAIGRQPGDDPDAEFEDGFFLGFKARGTWWAVENIEGDSGLFDSVFESLIKDIRQWCEDSELPPWHAPKREGFFRFLVVRRSITADELLVNLVTTSDGLERFDSAAFESKLKARLGDRLAGFTHTLNDDKGERVETRDGQTHMVAGRDHVVEELHGLAFEIRMRSFFQTNPRCAERLYAQVMAYAYAEPKPEVDASDPITMDLFCGTGTIAQLLARHGGPNTSVVGVDLVEQAIQDARRSAERNGAEGLQFHAADVGRFLLDHPEYKGRISTIVLDPPRSGISPKSLRKVIRLRAKRIVYVSCNPATQARDLVTLRDAGYGMKAFKLVDQFPHTAHIEAVALLEFDSTIALQTTGKPDIAKS